MQIEYNRLGKIPRSTILIDYDMQEIHTTKLINYWEHKRERGRIKKDNLVVHRSDF